MSTSDATTRSARRDHARRLAMWTAMPAVLLACSKGPPPAAIVTQPNSEAGEDAGLQFAFQSLGSGGCAGAGTQSTIAISGTKIGVASLAGTTTTQQCTITVLGVVYSSNVELWDVCYAESKSDGTFSSTQVTSPQPYVDPTGVGLAFDSTGKASVAFTGVGSTPSSDRCGANDVFLTASSGATFGAPTQISNGSASNGLVAAQAGNCPQNVCNTGDTTGLWPTLAFDPKDNPTLAYRDVHFGFAVDDFAESDVEFTRRSGGTYSVLTVDVARGGGSYNRVAFTPAGLPAVLQYNEKGGAPGVYLDMDLTTGGFAAQEADGGWSAAQLSSGLAGAQLGFAISTQGLFAAAYYDMGTARLLYIESKDGVTWSSPASIDVSGATGFDPSLAFDSNGDPGIAYYKCNAQRVATCDPTSDGLYLARRTGGSWNVLSVHADPAVSDGMDPALGFVGDKAVIAFQETSFDPASSTSTSSWWIAEEQ